MSALDWTLPSCPGDFSSSVRFGSATHLADPSCLSCLEPQKVPSISGVCKEERPPSPIVVDGEEEYEVEAILKHKGKGARHLYLVMRKGYPITEASWEPESHL